MTSTPATGPARHPRPLPRGSARAGRLLACLLLYALASVGVVPAAARADEPRWQWPLPAPHRVLAPFDAPAHRFGPGHRGIDVDVPAVGAPVRAVEAGTVRFSGMVAGRPVVSVAHAGGLVSTYEPVVGVLAEGRAVRAGTVLGALAEAASASHCPGRACLHLGARRGEDYVDPVLLLGGRGPSVLLPWTGGRAGGGPAPPERRGGPPGAGSAPTGAVESTAGAAGGAAAADRVGTAGAVPARGPVGGVGAPGPRRPAPG